MRVNVHDIIKDKFLTEKNIAWTLYILNEIPSCTEELSQELQLSNVEVKKILSYLKRKKLIKMVKKPTFEASLLIKKKRRKFGNGHTKKIKFYFISQKGMKFLPYVKKIILNKGDEKCMKQK